jgi:hypothetical protein
MNKHTFNSIVAVSTLLLVAALAFADTYWGWGFLLMLLYREED